MSLKLEDIEKIEKNPSGKGRLIRFFDGRAIHMLRARTIPALLTLIRYGEGCEKDLTSSTQNLEEIKALLKGKIPDGLIRDSYGDANKPFSELWNNEKFDFITNPSGEKRLGSQKYILDPKDHDKLFKNFIKVYAKPPKESIQKDLLIETDGKCNLCKSLVRPKQKVTSNTFSKDRSILEWDHRVPLEVGGANSDTNYQPLCHYCNKSKSQRCSDCDHGPVGCKECALAFPESFQVVVATGEDISDKMGL